MDSRENTIFLKDVLILPNPQEHHLLGMYYKTMNNLYWPIPKHKDMSLDGLITYETILAQFIQEEIEHLKLF